MTQEDKELLLKDLCARLPYGAFVQFEVDGQKTIKPLTMDFLSSTWYHTEWIKPYLRPMSSMTEEEEREVMILWNEDFADKVSLYHCYPKTTDFYNAHHLDYRGLIEKGLALEAHEDMYKL